MQRISWIVIIVLGLAGMWPSSVLWSAEIWTEKIIDTHPDGSKAVISRMRNGTPVKMAYYQPDGKLRKILNLERKSISATTYYENGNPRMQIESVESLPDGTWTIWFKDGRKFSESQFVKGKIIWVQLF